ncbi:MAG: hypothetical protein FJ000_06000 [Actinobacteria bacterium]|nr:hypothetical protein [Actinomycetota bacterium]
MPRLDMGAPRVVVTALAALALLLLLVVGLAGFSSAAFSSSGSSSGNALGADKLVIAIDREGSYVLDAKGLRPGETRSGDLAIVCEAGGPAQLSLSSDALVVTPAASVIAGQLELRVEDLDRGLTVYRGPLDRLAAVSLGDLAASGTRRLRFSLTFPLASADPALQGHSAALTVRIVGVSP